MAFLVFRQASSDKLACLKYLLSKKTAYIRTVFRNRSKLYCSEVSNMPKYSMIKYISDYGNLKLPTRSTISNKKNFLTRYFSSQYKFLSRLGYFKTLKRIIKYEGRSSTSTSNLLFNITHLPVGSYRFYLDSNKEVSIPVANVIRYSSHLVQAIYLNSSICYLHGSIFSSYRSADSFNRGVLHYLLQHATNMYLAFISSNMSLLYLSLVVISRLNMHISNVLVSMCPKMYNLESAIATFVTIQKN